MDRGVGEEVGTDQSPLVEGKRVRADHPLFRNAMILCLEYGLIEEVDEEQYQVTEAGERFFENESNAGELEKQVVRLGRDTAWYDTVLSRLRSGN